MFRTVGAPAFLALATQRGSMNAPQVRDIYHKIKAANLVMPTLSGLPRGKSMDSDTAAHLRRWFFETGENNLPILYKMFERRFGVNTGVHNARMARRVNDNSTTVGDFTAQTLRMSWPVMERLPPAAVEDNPRWRDFCADVHAGSTGGNAFYWDREVVVGIHQNRDASGNLKPVNQAADDTNSVYYRRDAHGNVLRDASGRPIPVDRTMHMTTWNLTLRHEIGHAVDDALGLTRAGGVGVAGERHAGAWRKYHSYAAFVDAMIAAHHGMRNGATWPAAKDGRYRGAMIWAVTHAMPFKQALVQLYPHEASPHLNRLNAGMIAAVWEPQLWTQHKSSSPWYGDSWVRIHVVVAF